MAPRTSVGLLQDDVVLPVQQVRTGEPRDPATDDRYPHAAPLPTKGTAGVSRISNSLSLNLVLCAHAFLPSHRDFRPVS
jgi:hypothetical protein